MNILYVHGFKSAATSHKAQLLNNWVEQHAPDIRLQIPTLSHFPTEAVAQLEALIDPEQSLRLIGSSLGGYYATYLVERLGGRAVLINPAVKPYELLQDYWGENENLYTGEIFEVTQVHCDQLLALDVSRLQDPSQYYLMVETGDETLDYRQSVAKYLGAKQFVRPGGEHAFTAFEENIPAMLSFLGYPDANHL